MKRKSIEEILVAAARREPMDAGEAASLERSLASSARLRAAHRAQEDLNAELAALRRRMRVLRAPSSCEDELAAAFRAHRPRPAPPARPWRRPAGLAAVLAVGAAVGALAVLIAGPARIGGEVARFDERSASGDGARVDERTAAAADGAASFAEGSAGGALAPYDERAGGAGRRPSPPFASGDEPSAVMPVGAFQPLMYAPDVSPSASYSVVRVRVPLAVPTSGGGAELIGTVEADVLVGVDGLASGIRFDRSTAVLVSNDMQEDGGVE